MVYIELEVKNSLISHGFNDKNQSEVEEVTDSDFMKKIIAIDRIKSISEKYLLVEGQNGRDLFWEYKGTLDDIKSKLSKNGLLVV